MQSCLKICWLAAFPPVVDVADWAGAAATTLLWLSVLWQAQLVLEILERHPQLPLLVVSDSDTVWLRQPWAYFEQRPAADFFISTDCLSTEVRLHPALLNAARVNCGALTTLLHVL
jgi:hypothetical protein